MNRAIPRIVIGGTQSGTGKTSFAIALVACLKRRGFQVQTFKVGPDFLDPTYLALASDRPCYNLDGWMSGKDYVLQLFHRAASNVDIAVIEGVMGIFDGSNPVTSEGSTAEVARWLKAPVLLIVNVHGMARSLAAIVKGCSEFERDLNIAGIIANYVGSERHRNWLKKSLDSASLPPLLGAIPRGALPTLPSRHLGLVTADSESLPEKLLEKMAIALEKYVSLDAIINIAKGAPIINVPEPASRTICERKSISLGVAYDKAFHFYYPDNLDELAFCGCELIRFSPLKDTHLPEGINGLYIGGGYPEEYAEVLAENREMQESIRQFAMRGLPIYAECGGLMYLTKSIERLDGKRYPMVGLLPTYSRMLERPKSLGYVEVTLINESLWGLKGERFRGHEFHYSELIGNLRDNHPWKSVYRIKRRHHKGLTVEGFQQNKILASYIHLHWASRPEAVKRFINHCKGGL